MKQFRKNNHMVMILIITGFVFLVSGTSLYSEPDQDFHKLLGIAEKDGMVRVIVDMDVPNLEVLTALSNRFRTGDAGKSKVQYFRNVDLKLEEEITGITNSILHQLNGKGYRVNHSFSTLPYLALDVSAGALKRLKELPEVKFIIQDKKKPLPDHWKSVSQDQDFQRTQLDQSRDVIGAEISWDIGFTGNGWYVAVLDTGIRRTHEFFTGKNIVEKCFSAELDCPNGQSEMSGTGAANHYNSIYAGYDHGTHVAGIAAGNNRNDFYGVAKDSNIIAVQVFSRFSGTDCAPQDYCVLSWDSDQLKGLEFVYQQRTNYNIAAVNISLGGGEYSNQASCENDYNLTKNAIDNLRAVGIATVCASGNEYSCSDIIAPACISSAIAVGATSKIDIETIFSNWNYILLDLFAPGETIRSSTGASNSSYEMWDGTSMATPHVTGAWALFKQFSNSGVLDILNAFKDSGKMVTTRCGSGQKKPRIDVGMAIMKLLKVAPPLNFSGEIQENYSLLQTEYINILTWETNPLNEGKNIQKYRVYEIDGAQKILLAEVDSSVFEYYYRKVNPVQRYTYAVSAINDEGLESVGIYLTIDPQ